MRGRALTFAADAARNHCGCWSMAATEDDSKTNSKSDPASARPITAAARHRRAARTASQAALTALINNIRYAESGRVSAALAFDHVVGAARSRHASTDKG